MPTQFLRSLSLKERKENWAMFILSKIIQARRWITLNVLITEKIKEKSMIKKKKILTENEETGWIKKIALLGPRVTDGRVF